MTEGDQPVCASAVLGAINPATNRQKTSETKNRCMANGQMKASGKDLRDAKKYTTFWYRSNRLGNAGGGQPWRQSVPLGV